MPPVALVTIDSAGADEPITIRSPKCRRVTLLENAGGATANLLVRGRETVGAQGELLAGIPVTVAEKIAGDEGFFLKGETVANCALGSGSAQFIQFED